MIFQPEDFPVPFDQNSKLSTLELTTGEVGTSDALSYFMEAAAVQPTQQTTDKPNFWTTI